MEDRSVNSGHHQFVIRVWQEPRCQQPTAWRIRIHHVNSGDVFFSTDVDQALEQMKEIFALPDKVTY